MRIARAAAGLLVAAVALAWPSLALAHVTATATPGGAATAVSFTFTHGCASQPTTSLRVQLPDGTADVQAADPPGWSHTLSDTELHWSGGSIPDGQRGTFTATMQLPGAAGETVFLPTLQGCPSGEEAWIDRTQDPEATNAAPRVVLVTSYTATTSAPSTSSPSNVAESTSTTATPTAPSTTFAPTTGTGPRTAPASSGDEGPPAGVLLAVGAGVLVFIVVGGLLLRGRTGPS